MKDGDSEPETGRFSLWLLPPIAGLAVLSLVPVVYKKVWDRRA